MKPYFVVELHSNQKAVLPTSKITANQNECRLPMKDDVAGKPKPMLWSNQNQILYFQKYGSRIFRNKVVLDIRKI